MCKNDGRVPIWGLFSTPLGSLFVPLLSEHIARGDFNTVRVQAELALEAMKPPLVSTSMLVRFQKLAPCARPSHRCLLPVLSAP